MPLVAIAVLAYAAGLLLGFGGVVVPSLVVAGVATLLAILGRVPASSVGVAALLIAGVVTARACEATDARCRTRAMEAAEWTVDVEVAAAAGVLGAGVLHGASCTLPARVAIRHGDVAAGARVRLSGVLLPARRGVLLREARVVATESGTRVWPAARARATLAVDRVFRGDSALARALLVADVRAIPPAMRERFADAGLVHILSISGLHVAIVAAAIQLALGALRIPARAATLLGVAITALYVAMLGAPPPAVRAAVMLTIIALAGLAQRHSSPWAPLALGAVVPLLLDPRTAAELGWQLSVAGMTALVASGALVARLRGAGRPLRRLRGWRLHVTRELVASTVACLTTAPLIAWAFGSLSLVAPLSNLVAAPLVGVLQPTLFLALAWAPVQPIALLVADAAHPLLRALDLLATIAAGVPGAAVAVAPTFGTALCSGVAACALLVACAGAARHVAPALGVVLLSLAGMLWLPLVSQGDWRRLRPRVELHMLDVGQGDALALRTPRGRWIVFDAGGAWRGGDAGRSTVVPYLRRRGGAVAAFVLSHPHTDHVGGAATLLRALRPAEYWDPGFAGGAEAYRASLDEVARRGILWRRVHPGDSLQLDGVSVSFLAPDSAWTAGLTDPNLASTVALVRYGAVRFLLVGDAERAEEDWLLAHLGDELRADVLKVGHHGSRTSSTPAFLSAVAPRVALVSVGAGNFYGLPNASVMLSLEARGASVLRTDLDGAVVVRSDGHALSVESGGSEWSVAARTRDTARLTATGPR